MFIPQKQASCKKQAHVQALKTIQTAGHYPQEFLPCPSGESPLLKQTEQFAKSIHYSHLIYKYNTAALF
jgi:hypothetical protein